MADLLLELLSEEIPARMQAGAARDLERLVAGALSDRGLYFEGVKAFAGPRRLTLAIAGLPAKQRDVREELKGPKLDAPAAAIEGFLKKTGLSKDQLKVEKTPKGDVYMAVIEREGRETGQVLAEILPEVFAKLPWPKSMRWPQKRIMIHGGALIGGMGFNTAALNEAPQFAPAMRWVRPLHSILCTFDGEVVPFSFAGIQSGNVTRGHRFLSEGEITVRRYDDYVAALHKAHVVLDAEQRKAIIFEGVKQAAFVHGLEMIPDEGLLNEVAGLAEWPVVLIGRIEDQFMDVPAEILQTSMRTHQKYFSLREPKTGKLANRFALVANMIAEDGGQEIVAGNERVLRARLSDAKFFWDEDRKHTLESRVEALKGIVFHAKLGTQYQRVERIAKLAGEIARKIGADPQKAERAARLAKADLTSGVVGEFPELQGVMGRYFALHDKEDAAVADAIRDHYKPAGPSDVVPTEKTSVAVALADKLDMLVCFFGVRERPTGSGDPFALRRAALGLIRIVLENNVRLNFFRLLDALIRQELRVMPPSVRIDGDEVILRLEVFFQNYSIAMSERRLPAQTNKDIEIAQQKHFDWSRQSVSADLFVFMQDRLKVALKEKGTRHDLIDAVFSLGREDDLVRLVARVEALQAFLKTDDGANLLAGFKRGANILKAEEKKNDTVFTSEVAESLLEDPAEKGLFAALEKAKFAIVLALDKEDFAGAMGYMAALRAPVDGFFEGVKVNDDDPKMRQNRLGLLASFRAALLQVADFSKIEG